MVEVIQIINVLLVPSRYELHISVSKLQDSLKKRDMNLEI